MNQKQAIKFIRKMYARLFGCKDFTVEPFVIRRDDGYSGFYNVMICREAVIILSVEIKPSVQR